MSKNKSEKEPSKGDDRKTMSVSVNRVEDANVDFIDFVQANWNPEVVILSLIQLNKEGALPQGVGDDKTLDGRLVKKTAFTWPHIVRLRDLLDKAIEENREKVISVTSEAMLGEKETKANKE